MINQKDTIPEQEGSGCSTAVEHMHQEKKNHAVVGSILTRCFFLVFSFPPSLSNKPSPQQGNASWKSFLRLEMKRRTRLRRSVTCRRRRQEPSLMSWSRDVGVTPASLSSSLTSRCRRGSASRSTSRSRHITRNPSLSDEAEIGED